LYYSQIIQKTSPIYEDKKWTDDAGNDIIDYTGMGQEGDQSFDNGQNKTLKNSNKLSVKVYLFETYEAAVHIFRGEVKLYEEPTMKQQKGRLVCIFPLLIGNKDFYSSQEEFEKIEKNQEGKLKKQDKQSVYESAKRASNQTKKKSTATVQVYYRDPIISTHVKNRAHGRCDLCGEYAAFNDRNGNPYLECHHVEWLSHGGRDSIENAVALDPTCHRKMHELDLAEDVEKLKSKIKEYISRDL
jgi:5-methylcytosine-specific restriction protein A